MDNVKVSDLIFVSILSTPDTIIYFINRKYRSNSYSLLCDIKNKKSTMKYNLFL